MPEPRVRPDDDPYAVPLKDPDLGRPQSDRRPPSDERRPPDRPRGERPGQRALLRVQIVAGLSAVAAVTAVVVPPLGLGLGVATLVAALTGRRDARLAGVGRFGRAVPVVGGVFAVLVGGVMSLALLLFGDELGDYQRCNAGAITHAAKDRCQDELVDAVEERFGSL